MNIRNYLFIRRKRGLILFLSIIIILCTSVNIFNGMRLTHTNFPPVVKMGKKPNTYESSAKEYAYPGEKGSSSCLKYLHNVSIPENNINIACSDIIPLERTLVDIRLDECKYWEYPANLQSTTVIIVFYNEIRRVLLRTIYSVYNRSPKGMTLEILLIDDASTNEDLHEKLEKSLEHFGDTVRLIRNENRHGFVISKNHAAEWAVGEILVFLDSRCEVNVNWLPPLIVPVMKSRWMSTSPIEDFINFKSFKYQSAYGRQSYMRGEFDWDLSYSESPVPQKDLSGLQYKSQPYPSPIFSNILAINRFTFLEMTAFDYEIRTTRYANLEFSFKLWHCGVNILRVPCSRVGIINIPLEKDKLTKDILLQEQIDKKRVVELWFENEYKDIFYIKYPMMTLLPIRNIHNKIHYKELMKCRSFKWYLDTLSLESKINLSLTNNWRIVRTEPKNYNKLSYNIQFGSFQSLSTQKCLDTDGIEPNYHIKLRDCVSFNNNQLFRLNEVGNLIVNDHCVLLSTKKVIITTNCSIHSVYKFQSNWEYHEDTKLLMNMHYTECLAVDSQAKLVVKGCDKNDTSQHWIIEKKFYLGNM